MNRCFICGDEGEHLHEKHHLVPRRLNGSNKKTNLIRLCPGCHRALEKLYDHEFYEMLSKRLRLGYSLNERGKWVTTMEADRREVEDMGIVIEASSEDEFEKLTIKEKCAYLFHNHEEIDDGHLSERLNTVYRNTCTTIPESEMTLEERLWEIDAECNG